MFIYLGVKEKADIYHFHEPELLIAAGIIKLALLISGKRIAIIHEIRDFYLSEAFLDSRLNRCQKTALSIKIYWDKMIHRICDHIIGVEESKIERPLSYGISPQKITVIENYVPLDLFHEYSKQFDPQNFVLGYSGGLSFLRGIDKLANACVLFGKKVNIRPMLLLAGRFSSNEEEKQIIEYCKNNEQFVNLKFLGWIDHTEVPVRLAEVDICFALFYSKRYDKVFSTNAGPIKLYEYMALGKPIIATNAYALEHTINNAQCGIVVDPEGGVEAIVDAIEFYFKNPERLLQDGRNGRLAVEKYFNWSIAERKLFDVYKKLACTI